MSVCVILKYQDDEHKVIFDDITVDELMCYSIAELGHTTAYMGHNNYFYLVSMVVDEYLLDNFFMECLRSPAMLLIAINAVVSKSLPKGENITLDVEDILKKSSLQFKDIELALQ